MCQIWACCARSRGAADLMARSARLRAKSLASRRNLLVRSRLRRLALSVCPCVELFLGVCNYQKGHVGVLHAAELCTLPAIDAGVIGTDGELVGSARNEVLFA